MPEETPPKHGKADEGRPLDGIVRPEDPERTEPGENEGAESLPEADGSEEESPDDGQISEESEEGSPPVDRRTLFMLIAIGGIFLFFFFLLALILVSLLPSPDGGKQGLRMVGNAFFAIIPVIALGGLGFFGFRFFKAGYDPLQIGSLLMKPSLAVLSMIVTSAGVLYMINQQPYLPIDILEPKDARNLTAPVSITFGTDTLRSILKKTGKYPKRYMWDFDGDGNDDVTKQEPEVTTMYPMKGTYNVRLTIGLGDGLTRTTFLRLAIPNAVFTFKPQNPIQGENITFDISNLIPKQKQNIQRIVWDFNGDGEIDLESPNPKVSHVFETTGTFQVQLVILLKNGLQENYVRPVSILAEKVQPFEVGIHVEGETKGSPPLGITFSADVQEGIRIQTIHWTFDKLGEEDGESVNYVFDKPGDYTVTLEVADVTGRVATATEAVSVLPPLTLTDLIITGSPTVDRSNVIRGTAPLEVKLLPNTSAPFVTFAWEQESASRVYNTKKEYHAVYSEVGKFPLVLIIMDEKGRQQSIEYVVEVEAPRSSVTFTAVPPTGIAPLTVDFDASQSIVPGNRITGFSWIFGDEDRRDQSQLLGARVSHRYEKEGTYTASVKVLTEQGEHYDARKTIVVRSPSLDACFFPSRSIGKAPLGIRFDARCSMGEITSYSWNFGDGATNTTEETIQDHTFTAAGTYQVSLEITDAKGNVSSASTTITAE